MSESNVGIEMTELNVDGFIDAKGIRYIGSAHRRPNGQWVCLAEVGGALCLVEVRLRLLAQPLPADTGEPVSG